MLFAAATSTERDASDAANVAMSRALAELGGQEPRLAFVFASASYADIDCVPITLARQVAGIPVIGGTAAGAVFDGGRVVSRGVLVALLGGDDVRVMTATAPIASPTLIDVVPAGARIRQAAERAASEGFEQALCLGFAPSVGVDGDAFAAALRKGAGAHMQLAGALTGDDFMFDRTRVFADGAAQSSSVVMAGVFSRRPVAIAARHGCVPVGPAREVTRSDGPWLFDLDGRRAVDMWISDVRRAGGSIALTNSAEMAAAAATWELGLETLEQPEALVRAPMAHRPDGSMLLSAGIAEGSLVRLMHTTQERTLSAARDAASIANVRLGQPAAGVLVLSCAGRLYFLRLSIPRGASGDLRSS